MSKNKLVLPYKVRKTATIVLSEASATTTDFASAAIPEWASNIQFTVGKSVTTATGVAVVRAAGDDTTFTVSVDGIHWFTPTLTGGTTGVLQGEITGAAGMVNYATPRAKFIRCNTAQRAGTETFEILAFLTND